jgi:prepilin-type N-terminal cleavage/methylation domain-containing protein/prepilin-type processing-associated H-X9-DG protein
MRRQKSCSLRSGFTLVEILVAVAIISVLLGVILSQVAAAREAGRKTSCLSNEHQIGLAMLQYVQDYDEHFPSGSQRYLTWNTSPPPLTGEGWAGQIFSYVKQTGVFRCPDDPTQVSQGLSVVSYGYNQWISSSSAVSAHLAAIPYSSNTVLCFEVSRIVADITMTDEGLSTGLRTFSSSGYGGDLISWPHGGWGGGVYATGRLAHMSSTRAFLGGRHSGGANYLLVDGHAKWLKPKQVLSGAHVPDAEFNRYAAHFLDQSYSQFSK